MEESKFKLPPQTDFVVSGNYYISMESLSEFKIVKTIGKGTYGTVYLCKKKSTHELTIIKDIPVKSTLNDESQDADNEIKIISKLKHPNIIQYFDNFYYKSHVLICMEYATNGNLAEYMYKRRIDSVPQKQILFFFSQILLGVKYIHSMEIIHRDLKAENILLTGTFGVTVKIGDFGIAKMLMSGQKTSTVIGTPYYLAPELCDGKPYDTKTDVWALGCLLYEMCTHQRAFESETLTGLVKAITSGNVHPINTDIYERGMQDLVDSMLSVVPEKRPSVTEVMGKQVIISTVYTVFLDAENEALLYKVFNK